jgi:hypothetical protein
MKNKLERFYDKDQIEKYGGKEDDLWKGSWVW